MGLDVRKFPVSARSKPLSHILSLCYPYISPILPLYSPIVPSLSLSLCIYPLWNPYYPYITPILLPIYIPYITPIHPYSTLYSLSIPYRTPTYPLGPDATEAPKEGRHEFQSLRDNTRIPCSFLSVLYWVAVIFFATPLLLFRV